MGCAVPRGQPTGASLLEVHHDALPGEAQRYESGNKLPHSMWNAVIDHRHSAPARTAIAGVVCGKIPGTIPPRDLTLTRC